MKSHYFTVTRPEELEAAQNDAKFKKETIQHSTISCNLYISNILNITLTLNVCNFGSYNVYLNDTRIS